MDMSTSFRLSVPINKYDNHIRLIHVWVSIKWIPVDFEIPTNIYGYL